MAGRHGRQRPRELRLEKNASSIYSNEGRQLVRDASSCRPSLHDDAITSGSSPFPLPPLLSFQVAFMTHDAATLHHIGILLRLAVLITPRLPLCAKPLSASCQRLRVSGRAVSALMHACTPSAARGDVMASVVIGITRHVIAACRAISILVGHASVAQPVLQPLRWEQASA